MKLLLGLILLTVVTCLQATSPLLPGFSVRDLFCNEFCNTGNPARANFRNGLLSDDEVGVLIPSTVKHYCHHGAEIGEIEQHGWNCRRYYKCVKSPDDWDIYFVKHEYECPEYYGFNIESIYDADVSPCGPDLCPRDEFDCSKVAWWVRGRYQDPYDCHKYFECLRVGDKVVAHHKTCPGRRWFWEYGQNCGGTGKKCPQ